VAPQKDWPLEFLHNLNPLYSLSGLFVGFLVGMTGVGGGSLMTPLLVLVFGVHPVTAVGTDLLFAAITKAVGTGVHGVNRTINWKIVRNLASGSVPAALATLWLVSEDGGFSKSETSHLTTVVGAMLVTVSILLIFRPKIVSFLANYQSSHEVFSDRSKSIATAILGVLLGTLVTLSSVGAGAMGVTILLVLFPRMHVRDIVGSDIVHAVPLTLIAGAGYWYLGGVDMLMLFSLLVGSIPGVIAGSMIAPRMPDRILRPLLAAALALAGIKMFGA
jgi:uncharacterized protein